MPRRSGKRIDVLYVVALEEEVEPARAVAVEGVLGHPGVERWTARDSGDAAPYERGEFVLKDGSTFSVALAVQPRMGPAQASATMATLIERLDPRCLAMSGVCAGRPTMVALGDVIIAETAYFADEGKQTPDRFSPDLRTEQMPIDWFQRAKKLRAETLPSYGLPTPEEAVDWFLVSLEQKRYPADQPELRAYFGEQDWKTTVDALEARGLVRRGARHRAVLTPAGRARAVAYLEDHRKAPKQLPFSIRVGPITTRPYVDTSNPWEPLTTSGVRTVLGLEMESASVATLARLRQVPHWIVAKGVMDHATSAKNAVAGDRYKDFAARASAEVVWAFLAERRRKDPGSICHPSGRGKAPAAAADPAPVVASQDALPASNLKRLRNRFVDREAARARCGDALRTGARLITVHGPSGSGKSRLATEVAHSVRANFTDHVYAVDLSVVSDAALVLNKIVEVLQVDPGDPLIDALREVFRGTPTLLVMENFERVPDAADRLQDLLDVAPDLRVIVTSDAPLRLADEVLVEAEPLETSDGVALFVDRVQRAVAGQAEFDRIADLCAVLRDPLAIELVADYARTLDLVALEEILWSPQLLELENRARSVPERQRTLASAISWSFANLSAPEQDVFVRLSLLDGSWTREAAAAVASGATSESSVSWMSSLVERGFLVREVTPADGPDPVPTRYSMPFAMRAFGRRQLEGAPVLHKQVQKARATFYRNLAEASAARLAGPDRLEGVQDLSLDHTNIHAALSYLVEAGDVTAALRMAVVLDPYWWTRSYAEGYAHVTAVLDLAMPGGATTEQRLLRGRSCVVAGKLGLRQCDLARASSYFDEARRVGQAERSPALEALALERGAVVDIEGTRYKDARLKLTRALDLYGSVTGAAGTEGRADCLDGLGIVCSELGEPGADERFEEAMDLYADVAGPQALAWVRIDQAQVAYLSADPEAARMHAQFAQDIGRRHGEPALLMWSGHVRGHVALAKGDHEVARACFVEGLTLSALQGNLRPRLRAIEGLLALGSRRGAYESAMVLLAAVDRIRDQHDLPRANSEYRLIDDAVRHARAELTELAQTGCRYRGRQLDLGAATDFARGI